MNGTEPWIHDLLAVQERATRMERQLRVERSLVDVARCLAAVGEVDVKQVLATVGQSLGAHCVYLISMTWDDRSLREMIYPDAVVTVWHREGAAAERHWLMNEACDAAPGMQVLAKEPDLASSRVGDDGQAGVILPLLSSQDKLLGYLGVEYHGHAYELLLEDRRALWVLHDLLIDYFRRKESEERQRALTRTTAEALWRIDLGATVTSDMLPEVQVEHILSHGFFAECSQGMARLLGAQDASLMVGQDAGVLLRHLDPAALAGFVRDGYQMQSCRFSLRDAGRPVRHYTLNAVATLEGERIRHIWGSCVEVTEYVELERRLVSMLEEQQERIGRDLHDSVGQLLTGIRMLSTNLSTRYFRESDEGFRLAKKVARFAQEASEHVRDIYRGLAPPLIYQESLAVALESLVYDVDALPGVNCTFVHDGSTDVDGCAAKLQLYRISQEATNNALKHAKARNIWITLEGEQGLITLQIRDDGVGFNSGEPCGKSLGLHSMKHRAHSIQAELQIDSTPGTGTTITCSLPALAQAETADQP